MRTATFHIRNLGFAIVLARIEGVTEIYEFSLGAWRFDIYMWSGKSYIVEDDNQSRIKERHSELLNAIDNFYEQRRV